MIKMINPNDRVAFVSKYDTSEPKTQFLLRPLSSFQHGEAVLKYESDAKVESMFSAITSCLVEIREGEKVTTKIDDSVLANIPLPVILEMYRHIVGSNTIIEEDRKN